MSHVGRPERRTKRAHSDCSTLECGAHVAQCALHAGRRTGREDCSLQAGGPARERACSMIECQLLARCGRGAPSLRNRWCCFACARAAGFRQRSRDGERDRRRPTAISFARSRSRRAPAPAPVRAFEPLEIYSNDTLRLAWLQSRYFATPSPSSSPRAQIFKSTKPAAVLPARSETGRRRRLQFGSFILLSLFSLAPGHVYARHACRQAASRMAKVGLLPSRECRKSSNLKVASPLLCMRPAGRPAHLAGLRADELLRRPSEDRDEISRWMTQSVARRAGASLHWRARWRDSSSTQSGRGGGGGGGQ